MKTGGWSGRVTIATILAWGVVACRPTPHSVDELIARHTRAIGGAPAVESIKSIQFELHIIDPTFAVDARYRAMRPGRMRIDVMTDGKPVFVEAFNGARGWQWKGQGEIVEENPEAAGALRHGVELPGKLFGLHELPGRGHRVELIGRERIAGTDYYVLGVTLSDGYSNRLYIDSNSWLIARRRDFRPLHVDIDPRPTMIETVFSDFRNVAGVKFPFRGVDTDLETGKILETVQITRIVVNPDLDAKMFDHL